MRIKIIQANSLGNLETEINAWLEENAGITFMGGTIRYGGDWRSCFAVFWYEEETGSGEKA